MTKYLPVAFVFFLSIGLFGCGSETVAVDDPHENYTPELRAFDIIDSYDTDTLAYRSQCKAWCRQDLLLLSMIIVYYDFL